MPRFYLVSKEHWFQKSIHPVDCPITIGRGSYNDLQIKDLSVSRQHARIICEEGRLIVEDLKSQNGTLVNGHAVARAVLNDGDILSFGNVDFRVVCESDESENEMSETEIFYKIFHERKSGIDVTQSNRLRDVIAKVPLFMELPLAAREVIIQKAHLRVFQPTEFIFKEGDRGKSIFIVLDGSVEIFTQDNYGTPIPIAKMGPNSFFGERAILSGKPRCASAVVAEEMFVCELSIHVLRQLLKINPGIRSLLEEYSRKRFGSYVVMKENLGVMERRTHTRLNEELPVKLQFMKECDDGSRESVEIDVVTKNISVGGVKLEASGDTFRGVDCLGMQVRLAIDFPEPIGEVRSLGLIRSVQVSDTGETTVVGVEFHGMAPDDSQKLEEFLTWECVI